MIKKLVLVLSLVQAITASAQQKTPRFSFPEGSQSEDFMPTTILVKIKPGHEEVLKSYSGRTLIHPKSLAKAQAKRAPRASASGIDPTRYAEIPVRGGDVARFIDELVATGKFELAEPIYKNRIHFLSNDPFASSQYYLDLIKATQAWDLATGEDIIIGIVDSGGDLNHPDLASKIYIDPADPVDGIDNDADGYIDNNRGWDFMGADTLNLNDEDFIGDNDPSITYGGYGAHGTNAAGAAAAIVNNSTGIAGVGYQAKLLFTKHAADNQGANQGSIFLGYSGLLYAATHGAKIINLSWGGPYRSQIVQDLITYITLDLNCLVVAAAGNTGTEDEFYPAAYDHVLSVAASASNDVKAAFSTYGKTVDIIAPGVSIYTTTFDDNYGSVNGTSFSSPIVAGAAALVWSKFPDYTAVQVGEQLRVSADASVYSKNSSTLARKLGIGRLDALQALTSNLPAIRASNPRLVNANGLVAEPGEDAYLSLDFRNYLNSSSSLQITVTPIVSAYVSMKKSTITPGIVQGGQVYNNRTNPFQFKINPNLGTNIELELLITYSDGNYSDYEFISFLINPTYINIEENLVQTSVASNGRIGYENAQDGTNGLGFVYNDNALLFEMGILAGSSTSQLFNNIRSTGNNYDQDFTIVDKIRQAIPGDRSSSETYGSFQNNQSPTSVKISYRSLAWREEPYDKFVIMEYTVKNISAQTLSNFNFALFSDWDITENGQQDIAKWDAEHQMGYIYPAIENTRPHAGIRILKGISPIHYAIDNNQSTPGAPFGLYDGFTDQEKITALTSGIGRTEAGINSGTGADVSSVVGAGPYTIPANGEITVAFALMAADNFNELKRVAAHADTAYNFILTAPKPVVEPVTTCFNAPATLTATGANSFKWYRDFTGGSPVAEGPSLTTGNLLRDTVLYVANADLSYESVRTKAVVSISSAPEIATNGSGDICSGQTITLTASPATNYAWSNGATTRSITVSEPGSYSVVVSDPTLGCSNTSDAFSVSLKPSPTASFTISTPQLLLFEPIQFTSTSTGATTYAWNFGNNKTGTTASATQTYTLLRDYNVTLTVTNEFGCSASASQTISIITALPDAEYTRVFPNPAVDGRFNITSEEPIVGDVILTSTDGRQILKMAAEKRKNVELRVLGLAPGVYLIRFRTGTKQQVQRVVVD